jgi:hypothetical protein
MEGYTMARVTAKQRKAYILTHPYAKDYFVYSGRGIYKMFGWESQVHFCKELYKDTEGVKIKGKMR